MTWCGCGVHPWKEENNKILANYLAEFGEYSKQVTQSSATVLGKMDETCNLIQTPED